MGKILRILSFAGMAMSPIALLLKLSKLFTYSNSDDPVKRYHDMNYLEDPKQIKSYVLETATNFSLVAATSTLLIFMYLKCSKKPNPEEEFADLVSLEDDVKIDVKKEEKEKTKVWMP